MVGAPGPGDRVGPWTLGPQIGAGGIAAVFLAEGPAGVAAVKILHAARVTPEDTARLRREFLTLARLNHPSLVRVFDAGEHAGVPWIAMEYVDGCDLGTLLARWEAAPPADRPARVERILLDLCDALEHVHAAGVIHRDLKPGNVLVGADGRARLTDFGALKDPDAFPTNLTAVGRLVGTVAFMAPEQILGEGVDARADLYSLGAILYAMCTFQRPIQATTIAGYLARHLSERPRRPSEIAPDVPPVLERVCLWLLEKDPARRPSSAAAVRAAVRGEDAAPAVLHGREAALDWLGDRVRRLARDGLGGVAVLRGPVGSGRGRLAEAAASMAVSAGVRVHRGPASPPEGPCLWLPGDLSDGTLDARVCATVRARVAREGEPLCVVVAGGPGAAWATLDEAHVGIAPDELVLPPLARDAVRAVLMDAGAGAAVAGLLARRLADAGATQPGSIRVRLEALVEAGWLARGEDGALGVRCGMDALRQEPLPTSRAEQATARERLAGCDAGAVVLAEVLAVVGGPVTMDVCAAAVRAVGSSVDLPGACRAAIAAGWLHAEEDALGETVQLVDAAWGLAIRQGLESARASAIHAAVGRALVASQPRRVGAVAEVAAHHLRVAGLAAEAWPLYGLAASRAARVGDHAGVLRIVGQAAACEAEACAARAPGEVARTRLALRLAEGEARRAGRDIARARARFVEAAVDAAALGDATGLARARAAEGVCAAALGDVQGARGALADAMPVLDGVDSLALEARDLHAMLRLADGETDAAVAVWSQVCRLGEDHANEEARMRGLRGRAVAERVAGRPAAGLALLDEALVMPGGGSAVAAACLHLRGIWRAEAGDAVGALEDAAALESLDEEVVDADLRARALRLEVHALCGGGGASEAAALLGELPLRAPSAGWAWAAALRVAVLGPEARAACVAALASHAFALEPGEDAVALRAGLIARLDPAADVPEVVPSCGVGPAARARRAEDVATAWMLRGVPEAAARVLRAGWAGLDRRAHAALLARLVACASGTPAADEARALLASP